MLSSAASVEAKRLQALHDLQILNTEASPAFDRLCQMAQDVFRTPISLVTLLGSDTQWFKARCGVEMESTPRELAFCNYTIAQDDVLVVPDARVDERFTGNPLVTGEPFIRFYAGAPLILRSGVRLGSICVIDQQPRQLTAQDQKVLKQLAEGVVEELQRHRADLDLAAERERHQLLTHDHSAKGASYRFRSGSNPMQNARPASALGNGTRKQDCYPGLTGSSVCSAMSPVKWLPPMNCSCCTSMRRTFTRQRRLVRQ